MVDLQGRLSKHRAVLAAVSAMVAAIVARPLSERSAPNRGLQIQRRLADTEIDSLRKDRLAGRTIAQLANMYSIHRTTVLSLLKRAGGVANIVIH